MASKNKKIFNASHGLVMTFQPGANLKMVFESPQVMLYKTYQPIKFECVSQSETKHQFENAYVKISRFCHF